MKVEVLVFLENEDDARTRAYVIHPDRLSYVPARGDSVRFRADPQGLPFTGHDGDMHMVAVVNEVVVDLDEDSVWIGTDDGCLSSADLTVEQRALAIADGWTVDDQS